MGGRRPPMLPDEKKAETFLPAYLAPASWASGGDCPRVKVLTAYPRSIDQARTTHSGAPATSSTMPALGSRSSALSRARPRSHLQRASMSLTAAAGAA